MRPINKDAQSGEHGKLPVIKVPLYIVLLPLYSFLNIGERRKYIIPVRNGQCMLLKIESHQELLVNHNIQ